MNRWILTILLFLLLGAIVNVAVAWGSAIFVKSEGEQRTSWSTAQDEGHWFGYTSSTTGAYYVEAHAESTGNHAVIVGPHWSITAKPPPERGIPFGWQVFEYARGWPMLSHYYRWSGPKYGTRDLEWGWRISWLTRYQVQQ